MNDDHARDHLPPDVDADLFVNLGTGAALWDDTTLTASSTIRCRPEQLELDGSLPFGYLAGIADNNNAIANINTAQWEDNSILIEVSYQVARSARGTVEVRSRNSGNNDAMGVAQGVMLDEHGSFGQSQATSVTVPTRPMVEDRTELPEVEHVGFDWESDLTPAPIDLYLKGGLRLTEEGTTYLTQLDSGWASNYGSLHGGAIGLVLTRAIRYAAIAASPTTVEQEPISFNINYVRPAMVVPEPMEARARVISVTNRFCTIEGEFILPSGKPAARCRVIHRLSPKI